MRILIPLLATALLLAGCTSGRDIPAASTPEALRETAPPEGSAANGTSPAEVRQTVSQTITWDATAARAAIVCPPDPAPLCVQYIAENWFESYKLDPHNWTHATLNLTWTPSLPGQKMGMVVIECADEECTELRDISDFIRGDSPLTFDLPILPKNARSNSTFLVVVPIAPYDLRPAAYASARWDQPFHLEGTVMGVRE